LRHETPLHQMKTLGVRPMQGTFEIPEAQIIAPGDPYRSVLYYRMSKLGRGRMPMIGSEVLDERGLKLMSDWIRQLPAHTNWLALIGQLRSLEPASKRSPIISELLQSTSSALLLARTVQENGLPARVRDEVIAAGTARPEPQVRDLFEPFLPEEKRVRRLGERIQPGSILALAGDAQRGRELFLNNATMQCKNCHRVGDVGSTLGPDLSTIARKNSRAQLLESLLEPSKLIEPRYLTHLVASADGKIYTGLLVSESEAEIVLRDAQDKEHRIARKDVEQRQVLKQSLMPDLLLRDLTAEQAADLLAFLESLR
jgi:putative heme-binding domain-containing protein